MLGNEALDKINGHGSADTLAAHRAEQARLADATRTEKLRILGGVASEHGGTVPIADARIATEQARTSAQTAVVGAELAADVVAPGSSVFAPEGTPTPLDGSVTVNPGATPRPPEVRVNPPQGPAQ